MPVQREASPFCRNNSTRLNFISNDCNVKLLNLSPFPTKEQFKITFPSCDLDETASARSNGQMCAWVLCMMQMFWDLVFAATVFRQVPCAPWFQFDPLLEAQEKLAAVPQHRCHEGQSFPGAIAAQATLLAKMSWGSVLWLFLRAQGLGAKEGRLEA